MKIKLYLNVFFLVFIGKIVTANIPIERSSPMQYCGSKLADIMRYICGGIYNEHRKRNPTGKVIKKTANTSENNYLAKF